MKKRLKTFTLLKSTTPKMLVLLLETRVEIIVIQAPIGWKQFRGMNCEG